MTMDARSEGLTADRKTQAALTAKSVMRSYGPGKALARVDEMSATREKPSPGNVAFYRLVREYVQEAIETGLIAWRPIGR